MDIYKLIVIIITIIVLTAFSKIFVIWSTKGKVSINNKTIGLIGILLLLVNIILVNIFSFGLNLFIFLGLEYVLLISAFVDLVTFKIPNRIIVVGMLLGLIFVILRVIYDPQYSLIIPLIGCVSLVMFFIIINIITNSINGKDAYGYGDIKLFMVIGLFLGIEINIIICIVAILLSLVYAGISNRYRREVSKLGKLVSTPFAPFIFLASIFLLCVILFIK